MVTAHKFALASEQITADMVEVAEFPQVAIQYEVRGVPKTVINEEHSFLGKLSEMDVARAILKAIGKG